MINKLRLKIFWLIQISLSIVILGTIFLITSFSYKNTINSSIMFLERFEGRIDQKYSKPKEKIVDGLYKVDFVENKINLKNQTISDDVKGYFEKVNKKLFEKGYIDDYIYSVKKINPTTKSITLLESEDTINQLKRTIILSVLIGSVSLILIYLIAKKLSELIVKPVNEVFEKQKEFISDASHELKTPLAVIEANVDVIQNKFGDSKWITYIKKEVISMNKLVNDLLTLTRTENTTLSNIEKFNLSKEVEISAFVFESIIFEKKIVLETKIEENILFNGDKSDIKQLVGILMDNAIKHTKENGKISIVLNKDKSGIKLEVQNEGDEIKEEDREKIFERFYRVDKTRNRESNRYGLGLPIAKGIVNKYKGQITVNSKNKITKFIVKF